MLLFHLLVLTFGSSQICVLIQHNIAVLCCAGYLEYLGTLVLRRSRKLATFYTRYCVKLFKYLDLGFLIGIQLANSLPICGDMWLCMQQTYKDHADSREAIEGAFDRILKEDWKDRQKYGFRPPRTNKKGDKDAEPVVWFQYCLRENKCLYKCAAIRRNSLAG